LVSINASSSSAAVMCAGRPLRGEGKDAIRGFRRVRMAETPGRHLHDSDPTAQADWSVAVAAGAEATEAILET
jgi:hypothetical protein